MSTIYPGFSQVGKSGMENQLRPHEPVMKDSRVAPSQPHSNHWVLFRRQERKIVLGIPEATSLF